MGRAIIVRDTDRYTIRQPGCSAWATGLTAAEAARGIPGARMAGLQHPIIVDESTGERVPPRLISVARYTRHPVAIEPDPISGATTSYELIEVHGSSCRVWADDERSAVDAVAEACASDPSTRGQIVGAALGSLAQRRREL